MCLTDAAEWYNNKQLFEMLTETRSTLSELKEQMTELTTIVRDHNGLREKQNTQAEVVAQLQARDYVGVLNRLNTLENEMACCRGSQKSSKDYIGWMFALLAAIIAVFNYLR